MTRVYNAAVIGAGSGGQLSITALNASDRYNLVAVADISDEAQQKVKSDNPDVQVCTNHQTLFAAHELDVVCVSTWATSHLEITQAALDLSLSGILVEKPLADNYADARNLLTLVKQANLPVAVPHGLLVAPHVLEMIDLVKSNAIGELRLIEIECGGWDIINAGIHWLNFVVTLLADDPIDWVMACCDTSTKTFRDGIQVETVAVTYLHARSGVRVVMNTGDYVTTMEPDKSILFRLVGSHGMIEFYAWESVYRIVNAKHSQGTLVTVDGGSRTRHQAHLENLAQQMDSGKPDYRVAESSLAALEVCEAAFVSSQNQCAVTLPLEQFTIPQATEWQLGRPYSGQGGGRNGRELPEDYARLI